MNIPMRRAERRITREDALSILEQGEYGVLSLPTPGSGAYGVPLCYAVWNDAIYFHCAAQGYKLDCIRANGNVSFCVVGRTEVLPAEFSTNYESVIVSGRASPVHGDEKKGALMRLVEKYSPAYVSEGALYLEKALDETFVMKISMDEVTGKARRPR